jgi:hypothetical protein
VCTLKTASVPLERWLAAAIVAVIVLGGLGTARADTYVHDAWGNSNLIFGPPCSSPHDALQLNATRNPTDGNPPIQGNKLLMLSDATYTQPNFNCVESTTWTSNSAQRKAATVDGVYQNPNPTSVDDLYLPIARSITLRNLTLQNVDLATDTVEFDFRPVSGDSSLTLDNGSLTTLNIPGFYVPAHFSLTASGASRIHGWTGRIASQTTLNITPGAALTLDWCGDMNATLVTSSMYFGAMDNAATIDGGTLRLQQSYVTFGSSAFDPAHPSKMTFKNAARLEVTGDHSTLVADEFDFIISSLMLANNNRLRVRGTLNLDTASVVIGSDAEVHVPALAVRGLSTMALGGPGDPRFQPVQAGALQMQPDAILTLTGQGGLQTDFLGFVAPSGVAQYGQIIVNDAAELITGADGRFALPRGEIVTINRTDASVYGLMIAQNGGVIDYGRPNQVTNHLTNHGQINADDGGTLNFYGDATILGGSEGLVEIASGGVLGAGMGAVQPAINRLTTNNTVQLDNFSSLQLTLDPTGATNDQVRVGSTLWIEQWAGLDLSVINDKVLVAGTKFILVDYNSWQGNSQKTFNGYPDGSTLVLGANTYQVKYADSGDAGYAGAITLTVVAPVPPAATLLPATQILNGSVGAAFTPSAALVPSGFVGTVTYSITPILPTGLSLAIATGVISGVPTEFLGPSTFTIRGVGSSSGIATATVTLQVAKGSQTITFVPTPPPTYVPGGGFVVSANASSGLPVAFSSTTPTVCTVAEGTVFMLNVGTCTIVASQVGNADYNPALPVTVSITIAKAQPAVTVFANPGTIHVGETSTLTTMSSGGTGAISYAVSGPCTLIGANLLQGNDIGTCRVTALQAADGNYSAAQSSPVTINVQMVLTIPTLSQWGLLLLASMLALLTGWRLRRRSASVESCRD